ncbi:4-hydroxythreonine-4-phosphate dehydrogenase, partial [Salmonella enterica subsp. enterica serovar Johannesburg str. S5-703]
MTRFIILRRCIVETKTVAITMGDPAGIGPEIIVKALS